MNNRRILLTLGNFTVFISLMLVVPAGVALAYGEHDTLAAFGVPVVLGLAMGLAGRLLGREAPPTVYRREGLLIVTGCWLIAAGLGAVPYLVSGMIPRVEEALFESMSGFTTTGSTILDNLDHRPRGLLFWRSMTHWLGGMGIVVLFVAVLPALRVGGKVLYQFEVPGVEQDPLKPRIRETAGVLWKLYLLLSILEALLLFLAGLDPFDAVTHTFGTVATGGFSTHDLSIGHYAATGSVPVPAAVDLIVIAFMFLAGVNFALYFRASRQGPRVLLRDPEFRTYAGILGGAGLLVTLVLLVTGSYGDFGSAALKGFFQVVSVGTTTGYVTADFDGWPEMLRLFLVFLMFVGGCAGSTGGGMKVFRVMLVLRFIAHEVRRFVRPRRVQSLMIGGRQVPAEVVQNTLAFFALAIMVFLVSSLLMTALGLDLATGVTCVTATLWNIGPGLEAVGPSQDFTAVPPAGKAFLTALMLLGRLELFTALVILAPSFYRT